MLFLKKVGEPIHQALGETTKGETTQGERESGRNDPLPYPGYVQGLSLYVEHSLSKLWN